MKQRISVCLHRPGKSAYHSPIELWYTYIYIIYIYTYAHHTLQHYLPPISEYQLANHFQPVQAIQET